MSSVEHHLPPLSSGNKKHDKIGVLLLNLGTPSATDYWSVRKYLSEFLSDKRVIDYPAWLWRPFLQLVVLSRRPKTKGEEYEMIWNKETDESPLLTYTRSQAALLEKELKTLNPSGKETLENPEIIVDFAMRYGSPSTKEKIISLQERGCSRILLTALYPQYSSTTTATAYDKAFDYLKEAVDQPAIRTSAHFYQESTYIEALKKTALRNLSNLSWTPDVLLCSYHGLPKRYLKKGDPYSTHCYHTTELLEKAIAETFEDKAPFAIETCFQSRFGPEEWLTPYTVKYVEKLAKEGKKNIAIMAPAFFSDCIETLEEIQGEIKEAFIEAGGENFAYIPCLNDTPEAISVLKEIISKDLQGWISSQNSTSFKVSPPQKKDSFKGFFLTKKKRDLI